MMADIPLSSVRGEDTAMELKCVVSVPVVRFLKDRFGEEKAREVIADTRMNFEYLSNPNNWISLSYFCRLLDKLVAATGDPMSPYVAAQKHSDADSYRGVFLFLKHLGSPRDVYRLIVRFHSLWDRICEYEMLRISKNACVFRVKFPGMRQQRNNCLAMQGSLSAVPAAFGLPCAKVKETQCVCDGADSCVYEMKWVNAPERRWAFGGALAGSVLGAGAAWMAGEQALSICTMAATLGMGGFFAGRVLDYERRLSEVYQQNEGEAEALLEALRDNERMNKDLRRQVDERTLELSAANASLMRAYDDLKNSQEKTVRAEKQAAIGSLAAALAHDLNSPFCGITLGIEAIEREPRIEGAVGESLAIMKRATAHGQRIVEDLVTFTRGPKCDSAVDLKEVAEQAIKLFNSEHPGDITIGLRAEANCPSVKVDQPQIRQVLLNLLGNAADASSRGSAVEVTLEGTGGEEVVLSVRDHGTGMDEAVLGRLFDPLFTTKRGVRKGLGLGLSITQQLVERNGGKIEVTSRKGSGSTFAVRFPVAVRSEAGCPKGVPIGSGMEPLRRDETERAG